MKVRNNLHGWIKRQTGQTETQVTSSSCSWNQNDRHYKFLLSQTPLNLYNSKQVFITFYL